MKGIENIQLLDDRVLVKVIEKTKTDGGIVLPTTVTKHGSMQMVEATVIKTGPGRRAVDGSIIPISVKPGHTIITYSTQIGELEINGEKYGMLDERSIVVFYPENEIEKS